jgi:hypothetical protein
MFSYVNHLHLIGYIWAYMACYKVNFNLPYITTATTHTPTQPTTHHPLKKKLKYFYWFEINTSDK